MNKPHKLLDAQSAFNFLTSQAAYMEPGVIEMVYPALDYPSLLMVDTSAPEWIQTVEYMSANMYGRADWINGGADDVEKAGTDRTKYATQVHAAAIGYGFSLEEISLAQYMGINLPADDAKAARRAAEEMIYRVAIFGDTRKGFNGLVNNPNVSVTAAQVNWLTDPVDDVLREFNALILGQFTGTNYTAMANTILLPYSVYLTLASRRLDQLGGETVYDFLVRKNAYTAETGIPLRIRALRGLDTAGAGGTARVVAYNRDPNVVKLHLPMPHRFYPAFQTGAFRWDVPGLFRMGGTDIRRTAEFAYIDGVTTA